MFSKVCVLASMAWMGPQNLYPVPTCKGGAQPDDSQGAGDRTSAFPDLNRVFKWWRGGEGPPGEQPEQSVKTWGLSPWSSPADTVPAPAFTAHPRGSSCPATTTNTRTPLLPGHPGGQVVSPVTSESPCSPYRACWENPTSIALWTHILLYSGNTHHL